MINITCDKFTYENWPEGGRCASSESSNHGSKAKITLFGVKAHLLVRKENTAGITYVRIDDTVVAIVDFKSYYGEATNCIAFTSNELGYGEHTIEVETHSTSTIILESFYINSIPKENSFVLGYSDFRQIEGDWTQDSSTTPTVFSSASDPASVTFVFYGTWFYLTGVRGNNVGNLKISIDDGDFIPITEK